MERHGLLIVAMMLFSSPAVAGSEAISVHKTYGGIIDIAAPLTDEPPPVNFENAVHMS
jgi:hypothetical protein